MADQNCSTSPRSPVIHECIICRTRASEEDILTVWAFSRSSSIDCATLGRRHTAQLLCRTYEVLSHHILRFSRNTILFALSEECHHCPFYSGGTHWTRTESSFTLIGTNLVVNGSCGYFYYTVVSRVQQYEYSIGICNCSNRRRRRVMYGINQNEHRDTVVFCSTMKLAIYHEKNCASQQGASIHSASVTTNSPQN